MKCVRKEGLHQLKRWANKLLGKREQMIHRLDLELVKLLLLFLVTLSIASSWLYWTVFLRLQFCEWAFQTATVLAINIRIIFSWLKLWRSNWFLSCWSNEKGERFMTKFIAISGKSVSNPVEIIMIMFRCFIFSDSWLFKTDCLDRNVIYVLSFSSHTEFCPKRTKRQTIFFVTDVYLFLVIKSNSCLWIFAQASRHTGASWQLSVQIYSWEIKIHFQSGCVTCLDSHVNFVSGLTDDRC